MFRDTGIDNDGGLVPAVFMHIQKTAGTSVVQMMARHYGRSNVISHDDYVRFAPAELANVPFVSGHFGYSYAEQLIRDRYSFTFLRDPIERTLSFYYFCKKRDPEESYIYKLANKCALEEFLCVLSRDRVMRWFVYNTQVWYLACGPGDEKTRVNYIMPRELLDIALENTKKFSCIGLMETIGEDLETIFQALNVPYDGIIDKANITESYEGRDELTACAYELIHELTQLDRLLYEAVLSSRGRLRNDVRHSCAE